MLVGRAGIASLSGAEGDAITNYMDWGIQLGHRFLAWMVIRAFRREGLALLREHMRLARLFAGWVDSSPDFEQLAPVPPRAQTDRR